MWTLKLAKRNYSTAHKEKYEHWWQESCTVQNVCGINVLFLFVFSLYFVVRVHQNSSFTCKILKNVLLGDGLSLDPPYFPNYVTFSTSCEFASMFYVHI